MSGMADFFNPAKALNPFHKENPFGKATNPLSSAFGIKYGSAADDPEHWKRQQQAEKQRSAQALAEQKRLQAEEFARPENVRRRAQASVESLGESTRRSRASQYLAG